MFLLSQQMKACITDTIFLENLKSIYLTALVTVKIALPSRQGLPKSSDPVPKIHSKENYVNHAFSERVIQ